MDHPTYNHNCRVANKNMEDYAKKHALSIDMIMWQGVPLVAYTQKALVGIVHKMFANHERTRKDHEREGKMLSDLRAARGSR